MESPIPKASARNGQWLAEAKKLTFCYRFCSRFVIVLGHGILEGVVAAVAAVNTSHKNRPLWPLLDGMVATLQRKSLASSFEPVISLQAPCSSFTWPCKSTAREIKSSTSVLLSFSLQTLSFYSTGPSLQAENLIVYFFPYRFTGPARLPRLIVIVNTRAIQPIIARGSNAQNSFLHNI